MKKYLLILLFALISCSVIAETIDGPENVKTEPNGFSLFSLYDQAEVEVTGTVKDWCEITVNFQLTEEQFYATPLVLPTGTTLYDLQGRAIGELLADLQIDDKMTAGGAPGVPKWYGAELSGFTHKSSLRLPQTTMAKLQGLWEYDAGEGAIFQVTITGNKIVFTDMADNSVLSEDTFVLLDENTQKEAAPLQNMERLLMKVGEFETWQITSYSLNEMEMVYWGNKPYIYNWVRGK